MLRHVPNALSIARIIAALVMVGLALEQLQRPYTWLLLPALLSDIADGLIARGFGLESRLGAKLDSAGDALLTVAIFAGIWRFYPDMIRDHWLALSLFLGAGLLEYVLAALRYGRLSSFHTWSSKAAGFLLVVFVAVLFLHGFVPWLFYLAISVAILSNLEEYALLALLPRWRADVRGLWSLARKRTAP
jgi:phosphatidylglycerophosphate synthase